VPGSEDGVRRRVVDLSILEQESETMKGLSLFRASAALSVAVAAACASLPEAKMALPKELDAIEPVRLHGLTAGRTGEFDLDGARGRFARSASRLSLFDGIVARDKADAGYTLFPGEPNAIAASCRGRQTTSSVGVVAIEPKAFELRCDYTGAWSARLTLAAKSAAMGSRHERQGRLQGPGGALELRSVHRVQGSPLPLETPIGYVFLGAGRPVGAVELNGTTPRLWRPAVGSPWHDEVTHAALTLALLWDPANRVD